MPESASYQTFKRNVIHFGDRVDRIENGVCVGMPDVNCCLDGHELWLEIKTPIEPKRPTTALFGSNHRVSQDQINWMARQRRAGGAAFFLVNSDQRWLLLGAALAEQINTLTVNQLIEQAIWHTTKPVREPAQWKHLRAALLLRKC